MSISEKKLRAEIRNIILESGDNKFTNVWDTVKKKFGGEMLDTAADLIPGVSSVKKAYESGKDLKQASNQEKLNELLKGTEIIEFVRICEDFVSEFRDPYKSGELINELSNMPYEQKTNHIVTIFNEKCQNARVDFNLRTMKNSELPAGQFKQIYLRNR